jgi:hypothetical protein
MTTTDHETLEIFDRTLRGVLSGGPDDVDGALEGIGWRDFLGVDARSVVPLAFRLFGERLVPSSALDDVAFDALHQRVDGGVNRGIEATAGSAFGHPRRGLTGATMTDDGLHVDALVLGGRRDLAVTSIADVGGELRAATIAADALERAQVGGLDPSLGLVRVRGTAPARAVTFQADVAPDAVAVACRRALAYELLGASSAMLADAADYAKVRTQFGQPIGAFQAVKHRLADVYVAVRAATVVADESWESETELMTLAAKSLAARACAVASENCLQVLGAIGFTLEHDLHRFIRRGKVLDRLYGSQRELRIELGHALRARDRMPRPGSP